jgi:hypothetical protein
MAKDGVFWEQALRDDDFRIERQEDGEGGVIT